MMFQATCVRLLSAGVTPWDLAIALTEAQRASLAGTNPQRVAYQIIETLDKRGVAAALEARRQRSTEKLPVDATEKRRKLLASELVRRIELRLGKPRHPSLLHPHKIGTLAMDVLIVEWERNVAEWNAGHAASVKAECKSIMEHVGRIIAAGTPYMAAVGWAHAAASDPQSVEREVQP